jgi:hypothetical protein
MSKDIFKNYNHIKDRDRLLHEKTLFNDLPFELLQTLNHVFGRIEIEESCIEINGYEKTIIPSYLREDKSSIERIKTLKNHIKHECYKRGHGFPKGVYSRVVSAKDPILENGNKILTGEELKEFIDKYSTQEEKDFTKKEIERVSNL